MEKTVNCIYCKTKMIPVELIDDNENDPLHVLIKAKTFWQNFSNPTKTKVLCYCCGNCGKLELFAEFPDKIKNG